MPTGIKYTDADRRELIQDVQYQINQTPRPTLVDACHKTGISVASYNRWKPLLEGKVGKKKSSKKRKKAPRDRIQEAILEETNAFINDLEERIDKALNQAAKEILKQFKL